MADDLGCHSCTAGYTTVMSMFDMDQLMADREVAHGGIADPTIAQAVARYRDPEPTCGECDAPVDDGEQTLCCDCDDES